jgi:hypothetical protein
MLLRPGLELSDGLSHLSRFPTATLERMAVPFRDRVVNDRLLRKNFGKPRYLYNVHIAIAYLASRPDLAEGKEVWRQASNLSLLAGATDERKSTIIGEAWASNENVSDNVPRAMEDRWDALAKHEKIDVYEAKSAGCAWCGRVEEQVPKLCAGCSRVVYCNRACLSKDWKVNHKAECAHTRSRQISG